MKISKQIWVDDHVKWNAWRKRQLYKYNRYKGHAYVVCTSPHKHLLFEIIETRWLNNYYTEATVLALCFNKKQAISQVEKLVDLIYNQQSIDYTQL